jgi:hypothetical protein
MRLLGIIVRLWNFARDYAILLVLLGAFLWTLVEVYGLGVGPTPQLPPQGYVVENLEAKLQWHNGTRPAGFTLQISQDDPNFSNKLFLEREVSGTTFSVNDLESGHTYYWRLKRADILSATASFKTAPYAINF